jgi:hypothetical protein
VDNLGNTEAAALGPSGCPWSPFRLPEMKGRHLRQHRQHRRRLQGPARSGHPLTKSGRQLSLHRSPAGKGGGSETLLTVLTVFSVVACIRMILFPTRPSRLNVISMPGTRRNVYAPQAVRAAGSQPVFGLEVKATRRTTIFARKRPLPIECCPQRARNAPWLRRYGVRLRV